MQTVYAYRDNGPMLAFSRWKPRRVFCTGKPDHGDQPPVEHVVKFRQGAPGTAALISEIVCGELLNAAAIPTLERRLVNVSQEFAVSCKSKQEIPYTVEGGLHFGTVLRTNVENGPAFRIESLQIPQQVVDLWVFDSWVCTIDRAIEGNTLLELGGHGQFLQIACDQSDCFGGANRLADGGWKKVLKEHGPAESVDFLDRAIMECRGADSLKEALKKVDRARKHLDAALNEVPRDWWRIAGLSQPEIRNGLDQRYRRLAEIINLKMWEGLENDTKGGLLL